MNRQIVTCDSNTEERDSDTYFRTRRTQKWVEDSGLTDRNIVIKGQNKIARVLQILTLILTTRAILDYNRYGQNFRKIYDTAGTHNSMYHGCDTAQYGDVLYKEDFRGYSESSDSWDY